MTNTAIILAAGMSTRLMPLTENLPKCLLPMGSKAIVDWQLDALITAGVSKVIMVVGYRKEQIQDHVRQAYPKLDVTFLVNERFATTNTLYSLYTALQVHDSDFYYLNADVVFDQQILLDLRSSYGGGYLAVDRKQCREEEVKVLVEHMQVIRIGKTLNPSDCYGEFIGVARFTGPFAQRFRRQVEELAMAGYENYFFEYALDTMPDKTGLTCVDITGLACVEIDFPEDYEFALTHVVTNLQR